MEDFQELKGKKVLLISAMFFGYEKLIKAELERKGAEVDYFNERPDNGFWTKALIRIDRRLLARKTDHYYRHIIESTSHKVYDHILVIRGEALSALVLKRLRQKQTKARLSLYLWDSMHYNPNAMKILKYFDQVFSFDRVDVEKTPGMKFLPLFYGHDFERSADWKEEPIYDACFIGTVHTDRYKVLERIIENLQNQGCKLFIFCYYPSRFLYNLRALIDPGFRRFGKKHVKFIGMNISEVVDRIAESKAVIDVNRPDQLGLTMRTIEAVGAQRKLITTNLDIVNYDLYNESSVLIVDRKNPNINMDFISRKGTPFEKGVRKIFSISSWLDAIFNFK